MLPSTFEMFACDMVATKIIPEAKERIKALEKMSFIARSEKLIGHDGTEYDCYYAMSKN